MLASPRGSPSPRAKTKFSKINTNATLLSFCCNQNNKSNRETEVQIHTVVRKVNRRVGRKVGTAWFFSSHASCVGVAVTSRRNGEEQKCGRIGQWNGDPPLDASPSLVRSCKVVTNESMSESWPTNAGSVDQDCRLEHPCRL